MNNIVTSNKGINIIKQFEGFMPKPYVCPAGYHTIGYGHLLPANHKVEAIDELKANEFLLLDLEIAEAAITRNISVNLRQYQFDALSSFVFNLGGSALQRSTLRQKINQQAELGEICNEFLRWVYVGGSKLNGLIARRIVEAKLFAGELI